MVQSDWNLIQNPGRIVASKELVVTYHLVIGDVGPHYDKDGLPLNLNKSI